MIALSSNYWYNFSFDNLIEKLGSPLKKLNNSCRKQLYRSNLL